jgi:enoyl-CoA hydratase/carnithine racemase
MSESFVLTSVADGIGRITLNEPARLNPVGPDRVALLGQACREMSGNDEVRVVVVTGAGRGFCSGADLAMEIPETIHSGPGSDSLVDPGPGLWILSAMRQPVIAQVNGAAVGFGAEMALSADLRIAGTSGLFRFPFTLLGTTTDTGAATWLLPRLIGWSNAADVLYSGRVVRADEAAQIGLVNRVVPDEQLAATVDELATTLASVPAGALRKMKRMLWSALDERKAEHALRQYFEFNDRDPSVDPKAYFSSAKGTGRV